jgi:hypothetical protein
MLREARPKALVIQALPKGISLPQVLDLAKGDYMRDHTNVIAVGGSGTGKPHVCDGLDVET